MAGAAKRDTVLIEILAGTTRNGASDVYK